MANGNKQAIQPDNNGRARVPGKRQIPNWNTDVFIVAPQGYAAYDKGLPTNLPDEFQEGQSSYPITWFNNFGVGKKDPTSNNIVDNQNDPTPTYQVILRKLPERKRLCIYIPAEDRVQEITPENGSGRIRYKVVGENITFDLSLDDPPTGTFP